MNDGQAVFWMVFFAVFAFFVGGAVGEGHGEFLHQKAAVRAGVAYYTNDVSGKPQFKWKECK